LLEILLENLIVDSSFIFCSDLYLVKLAATDNVLRTSIEDKIRKVGFKRRNSNHLWDIWVTGDRIVSSKP